MVEWVSEAPQIMSAQSREHGEQAPPLLPDNWKLSQATPSSHQSFACTSWVRTEARGHLWLRGTWEQEELAFYLQNGRWQRRGSRK